VQATLDGVLPGDRTIISRRAERDDRYVVRPEAKNVPLLVGGDHLADLAPAVYLGLDRTGEFLKAVRSEFVVKSVLDRTPLVRLDYRTDMNRAPVAHWQIHAERGAFSHLLSRAHAVDESRVGKPHDLSSLHFPVGGERFRPCLEDALDRPERLPATFPIRSTSGEDGSCPRIPHPPTRLEVPLRAALENG
jgi:hypothetical protein